MVIVVCTASVINYACALGMMTEPEHIFPFWDNYPDPAKWTDKQLGIPADDE